MSVEAAGIAPVSDAELGEYAPIWVPDYRYRNLSDLSKRSAKLSTRKLFKVVIRLKHLKIKNHTTPP